MLRNAGLRKYRSNHLHGSEVILKKSSKRKDEWVKEYSAPDLWPECSNHITHFWSPFSFSPQELLILSTADVQIINKSVTQFILLPIYPPTSTSNIINGHFSTVIPASLFTSTWWTNMKMKNLFYRKINSSLAVIVL